LIDGGRLVWTALLFVLANRAQAPWGRRFGGSVPSGLSTAARGCHSHRMHSTRNMTFMRSRGLFPDASASRPRRILRSVPNSRRRTAGSCERREVRESGKSLAALRLLLQSGHL